MGALPFHQQLKKIGEKVRDERLRKGWSQETLAYCADMETEIIGHIERGKRSCNIKTLLKIAEALKIDISDLL